MTNMRYLPTIGDTVLYIFTKGQSHNNSPVHPAMITRVLDTEGKVNLMVMLDGSGPQAFMGVPAKGNQKEGQQHWKSKPNPATV